MGKGENAGYKTVWSDLDLHHPQELLFYPIALIHFSDNKILEMSLVKSTD